MPWTHFVDIKTTHFPPCQSTFRHSIKNKLLANRQQKDYLYMYMTSSSKGELPDQWYTQRRGINPKTQTISIIMKPSKCPFPPNQTKPNTHKQTQLRKLRERARERKREGGRGMPVGEFINISEEHFKLRTTFRSQTSMHLNSHGINFPQSTQGSLTSRDQT